MKKIFSTFLIFTIFSCASYKPILDQNSNFFNHTLEERQAVIDKCTKDADEYLKQYKARRAFKEAGRKAIIGGVVGSMIGIVFGYNLKSLAKSAVIGAGIGAAVGGLSVAGEDNVSPDHIKQNYISNCLARQGYGVIGWE